MGDPPHGRGQEERLLLSRHGDTFRRYLAEVLRFLPRFELRHDVAFLKVRPHCVLRTFLDACFFLAAVPLALLFGHFQEIGLVPVFSSFPEARSPRCVFSARL